jgi:hypothetical protein
MAADQVGHKEEHVLVASYCFFAPQVRDPRCQESVAAQRLVIESTN